MMDRNVFSHSSRGCPIKSKQSSKSRCWHCLTGSFWWERQMKVTSRVEKASSFAKTHVHGNSFKRPMKAEPWWSSHTLKSNNFNAITMQLNFSMHMGEVLLKLQHLEPAWELSDERWDLRSVALLGGGPRHSIPSKASSAGTGGWDKQVVTGLRKQQAWHSMEE